MFTGLVEAMGRIERSRRTAGGSVIRIAAPFAGELEVGESVSVNGVCQTVVRAGSGGFEVDAVARTLEVTTLGNLSGGDEVNLERALRLGDRLGGHMVTGHVDGVGAVLSLSQGREGTLLTIEIPGELTRHVVPRGSIAIDGTSLTVAEVDGARVTVALIPETLRATIAGTYRRGTAVNIETDVLAKHQEKLLRGGREDGAGQGSGLTEERLRELGFTE
jgi:riboflavin synthase